MKKLTLLFYVLLLLTCSTMQTMLAKEKDEEATSFISTSLGYCTNTSAFGTVNNTVIQPAFSLNAGYYGKKGFNYTLAAIRVGNSDSTATKATGELDLGAGYTWTFLNNFTLTPSYTHYFFSKQAESYKSGVSDNAQLYLGFDKKWFSASVSGGYMYASSPMYNLIAGTSALIEWENLLGEGNSLTLQPGATCNFGTLNFTTQYAGRYYKLLERYAENNPDATVADLINYMKTHSRLPWVKRIMNSNYVENKLSKLNQDIVISDFFKKYDNFTLTSLNFSLPVTLYYKSLSLLVSATVYKPLNQPSYINSDWNYYLNFGLNWNINL